MYDDIIRKIGGFALYQKISTLLIISQFALYYAQFFSLSFLLYVPDYECLPSGQSTWSTCTREQACEDGTQWRFAYTGDKESFPNFYEQMDLTCEDPNKVLMIPVAYVIANFMSQTTASMQVKAFGMRRMILVMTLAQTGLTSLFLFAKTADLAICVSALLGLTGGR